MSTIMNGQEARELCRLTKYGSESSYVLQSEGDSRISKGRRPSHTLACRAAREVLLDIEES